MKQYLLTLHTSKIENICLIKTSYRNVSLQQRTSDSFPDFHRPV